MSSNYDAFLRGFWTTLPKEYHHRVNNIPPQNLDFIPAPENTEEAGSQWAENYLDMYRTHDALQAVIAHLEKQGISEERMAEVLRIEGSRIPRRDGNTLTYLNDLCVNFMRELNIHY